METSEAKEIVRASVRPMMHALGLQAWAIDIFYEAIETKGRVRPEGFMLLGECGINEPYQKAQITINARAHDNRSALLQTLRHELLHIVMGPIQTFADAARRHAMNGTEDLLSAHYHECVERTVLGLERLLDWGHNLSPARLATKGRRLIAMAEGKKRRKKR